MELVFAGQRERLIGGRIGDKSRETRDKRQRRELVLSALVINCSGRVFRSASFSSPNETLFEHFGEISRASFLRCLFGGNGLRQSCRCRRCLRSGRITGEKMTARYRAPG